MTKCEKDATATCTLDSQQKKLAGAAKNSHMKNASATPSAPDDRSVVVAWRSRCCRPECTAVGLIAQLSSAEVGCFRLRPPNGGDWVNPSLAAQAGTHIPEAVVMGPRLRGDDSTICLAKTGSTSRGR